jgi:3-hydroxyacyl-[acyl-carrier-protein] dehydratase
LISIISGSMTAPSPESQALSQALADLPHGPEFRFIHRLENLVPGVSGSAAYDLREEELFLRGHFPGRPLMPGVLMIEALAQLGGILVQTRPSEAPLHDLRLTAVRQVKILGSIPPGETLHIHAKLEAMLGTLAQVSGEIRDSHGQTLLTGAVMLSGSSSQ